MPTLHEMIDFICQVAEGAGREFSMDFAIELEKQLQQRFATEKIYVPPPNSRKNPARSEAIREAAKRLPTGVVAQRFGVSRQLVSYHTKKGKNPDG